MEKTLSLLLPLNKHQHWGIINGAAYQFDIKKPTSNNKVKQLKELESQYKELFLQDYNNIYERNIEVLPPSDKLKLTVFKALRAEQGEGDQVQYYIDIVYIFTYQYNFLQLLCFFYNVLTSYLCTKLLWYLFYTLRYMISRFILLFVIVYVHAGKKTIRHVAMAF